MCSGKTQGEESLLGASTQGRCRGPAAAAPGFLLLCKLLLFAVTNLFFSFSPPPSPSPLHPFLIAASNSHTHSSLLTRPFGISTWHLRSCSPWKGKEKKKSLKKNIIKPYKKNPHNQQLGPCALQGTWLPLASEDMGTWGEWGPSEGEQEKQHEVNTWCPQRDLGHGLRVLDCPLYIHGLTGCS